LEERFVARDFDEQILIAQMANALQKIFEVVKIA